MACSGLNPVLQCVHTETDGISPSHLSFLCYQYALIVPFYCMDVQPDLNTHIQGTVPGPSVAWLLYTEYKYCTCCCYTVVFAHSYFWTSKMMYNRCVDNCTSCVCVAAGCLVYCSILMDSLGNMMCRNICSHSTVV